MALAAADSIELDSPDMEHITLPKMKHTGSSGGAKPAASHQGFWGFSRQASSPH